MTEQDLLALRDKMKEKKRTEIMSATPTDTPEKTVSAGEDDVRQYMQEIRAYPLLTAEGGTGTGPPLRPGGRGGHPGPGQRQPAAGGVHCERVHRPGRAADGPGFRRAASSCWRRPRNLTTPGAAVFHLRHQMDPAERGPVPGPAQRGHSGAHPYRRENAQGPGYPEPAGPGIGAGAHGGGNCRKALA